MNQRTSHHLTPKIRYLLLTTIFVLIIIQVTIIVVEENTDFFPSETENLTPASDNYAAASQLNVNWIIFMCLTVCGLIICALSYEQVSNLIRRYYDSGSQNFHRLSIEEIFENENRKNIIDQIIQEPGIHFNELRRRIGISIGQLEWHLNLLEQYGIICLTKVGQYITFTLRQHTNPLSNLNLELSKSRTTLEILHLISENPQITASELAVRMGLKRNTIKYHVDKLIQSQLIRSERQGRELLLFRIESSIPSNLNQPQSNLIT
jgi:DNA-binding transcriptional ArsR family regulator